MSAVVRAGLPCCVEGISVQYSMWLAGGGPTSQLAASFLLPYSNNNFIHG